MTKEQLDDQIFQVRGFVPKIVVGPGHLIRTYDGYGDPYPDYYRGVPVFVHDGLGEMLYVVPMHMDFD